MTTALARALHYSECHEDVIRLGEHEPCDLPAVAVRLDPECGEPYPVCTKHARTPGSMVPIDAIVRAVRESIAAELTETVRLRLEEREWSESRKDYLDAGWKGGPDDGDRMFWSAGFARGFDMAARIARGESR